MLVTRRWNHGKRIVARDGQETGGMPMKDLNNILLMQSSTTELMEKAFCCIMIKADLKIVRGLRCLPRSLGIPLNNLILRAFELIVISSRRNMRLHWIKK